jgi:hypothetical protein
MDGQEDNIPVFGVDGSRNEEGKSSDGKGWKAREELALLEAVELYGYGNWDDTAKLVGTRSADEVRDHFVTYYVQGNVGRVCWSHASRETYQAKDHTCSSGSSSSLSPSLTTPLQAIPALSLLEQQHLGYMPKRDDFEREFDNEVEMLISTLRINPHDEDELDVDLKVAHIDMYNRRLRERFRKKAVVRDYALVTEFYKSLANDPEIQALLDPASYPHLLQSSPQASTSYTCSSRTMIPCASTTSLVGSNVLHSQSSLANQTSTLSSRLQSMSSTATSPASPSRASSTASSSTPVASPVHSRSRNPSSPSTKVNLMSPASVSSTTSNGKSKKKSQVTQPSSPDKSSQDSIQGKNPSTLPERVREQIREKIKIFSQFQSALDQQQMLDSFKREKELKMRIKELIRCRKNGLKKLSEIPAFDSVRLARVNKKDNKKNDKKKVSLLDLGCEVCCNDFDGSRKRRKSEEEPELQVMETKLNEFDVNSFPSARLLSQQEKRLCSNLRLTPSHYISIKGLMMKVCEGLFYQRLLSGYLNIILHSCHLFIPPTGVFSTKETKDWTRKCRWSNPKET